LRSLKCIIHFGLFGNLWVSHYQGQEDHHNWAIRLLGASKQAKKATSKYEIQFVYEEHINRYDLVASRKIVELKCINYDLLESFGLLNDLNEFLEFIVDFRTHDKPM